MKTPSKFIIIDDDELNNKLCAIIIRHALGLKSNVHTFSISADGLAHILSSLEDDNAETKAVLFLDINMPQFNGWEILAELQKSGKQIKEKLSIYMLSSSIDPKDKQMALNHPLVKDFIEKPLTVELIATLFSE